MSAYATKARQLFSARPASEWYASAPVENAPTIDQPRDVGERPARPSGIDGAATTLLIALLWLILWRSLSIEWSGNEQYGYGWFVPFFAAYLFWLRWEDRPPPTALPGTRSYSALAGVGALVLVALLPMRAFEVAAPDWRPLAWLHALAVVGLTLLFLFRAGGISWLRHFAFPVAFTLVAVPWIAAVETMTVQGLMRIVAALAAECLGVFGIPAQLEGNLLRLRTGLVGVNEACSGVRSLQTSLMIGLLFGELNRLRVLRRFALIGIAAGVAFVGNVCRAFFLVWVAAHEGLEATDRWHDWTGYSILLLVFAGTLGAAALLRRGAVTADAPPATGGGLIQQPNGSLRNFALPVSVAGIACAWLLVVEGSVEAWYRYHERDLVAGPRWTVRWPESAPRFQDLELDEGLKGILRFDEGRGASWLMQPQDTRFEVHNAPRTTAPLGASVTCVLYLFRWNAGRSSILRARGHRPDICLPSVGWVQRGDHGTRPYSSGEMLLPFRHFQFVRGQSGPQPALTAHAFFAVGEDTARGRRATPETEKEVHQQQGLSLIPQLWRLVRSGERPRGQQVMQVVFVSADEITPDQAQARLTALVDTLVVAQPAAPEA